MASSTTSPGHSNVWPAGGPGNWQGQPPAGRCREGREGREDREGRERRKGEEGGDQMIFYSSSLCLHTFLIFLLAITYRVSNCLMKDRVGLKLVAQYISE